MVAFQTEIDWEGGDFDSVILILVLLPKGQMSGNGCLRPEGATTDWDWTKLGRNFSVHSNILSQNKTLHVLLIKLGSNCLDPNLRDHKSNQGALQWGEVTS